MRSGGENRLYSSASIAAGSRDSIWSNRNRSVSQPARFGDSRETSENARTMELIVISR